MFDLFRSRDKAVRIFLTALLSLVALSMVTYLVPYGSGSGTSASDNVVAEIGKSKVTVRDVQMAIRAATRNREMPPGMMAHYVPQLIDQMINEKAMIYQAHRIGLQVTEADTANAIRQQMPQMFPYKGIQQTIRRTGAGITHMIHGRFIDDRCCDCCWRCFGIFFEEQSHHTSHMRGGCTASVTTCTNGTNVTHTTTLDCPDLHAPWERV